MRKEYTIDELSEKIFNKPANKIKYLLLTNYIHKSLIAEGLIRTGLYQWINVFEGAVKTPQEVNDYSQYDIVQINLSGQDVNLVNTIREKLGNDSKTKLVANSDYTTEMWATSFSFPETFKRELSGADMLFGTEKFMCRTLSEITGRHVYEIQHPCFVRRLKSLVPDTKENVISVLHHRYDNFAYLPHFAVRNHGVNTQLIGYEEGVDKGKFLTSTLYDRVLKACGFEDYCRQILRSDIIYEPFTFNSHGRATIDSAALGIPTVGSNRVQSVRKCFPYTCCDPYDTLTARKLIHKLLTDKEFNDKVIKYARNAVEFYNHKNSKLKYLTALAHSINKI